MPLDDAQHVTTPWTAGWWFIRGTRKRCNIESRAGDDVAHSVRGCRLNHWMWLKRRACFPKLWPPWCICQLPQFTCPSVSQTLHTQSPAPHDWGSRMEKKWRWGSNLGAFWKTHDRLQVWPQWLIPALNSVINSFMKSCAGMLADHYWCRKVSRDVLDRYWQLLPWLSNWMAIKCATCCHHSRSWLL